LFFFIIIQHLVFSTFLPFFLCIASLILNFPLCLHGTPYSSFSLLFYLLYTLLLRGRLPFPLPLQTVIVCLQVSSKVHNQLLQIADERAQSAEQKALQLERQLLSLRDKYGHPETSHPSTFTRPSTYTSTLGGYPSFSSTLLPPYTSSSPYSLSTSLSTHLPPSTSLEPFKLSSHCLFLASSPPTTDHLRPLPDSERAALPTSTGSFSHPLPSSSTDEHTSLLKPSTVLGKGAGSGSMMSCGIQW
ncbi:hypothetical protein GBAR_LOCUS20688, partial [Geodia barretti]